jgi:hypothetical protein
VRSRLGRIWGQEKDWGSELISPGARRRDRARQPVPAPARPLEERRAVLAAPPVAILPVLRPVRRPDQPGAPHRRGAHGHAARVRARARQGRPGAAIQAMPLVQRRSNGENSQSLEFTVRVPLDSLY